MRARINPWPALVDLFGAMLLATFGGLILVIATSSHSQKPPVKRPTSTNTTRPETGGSSGKPSPPYDIPPQLLEAWRILGSVRDALQQENVGLMPTVAICGDSVCLHVYFHFDKDRCEVSNTDKQKAIPALCRTLKRALDLVPDQHDKLEIYIEGHTDDSQPAMDDNKRRFLYNWNLSAARAASVLYEMEQQGLSAGIYSIVALGYADTRPLHLLPENASKKNDITCVEQWRAANRRTTLRIKPLLQLPRNAR